MGGTPATHGVALAAAPWQRFQGSRFVRLRSRRPRPPNGCARWLPEVAIAPPWSPGGASRAGSPSAVVRRSPGSRLLGVGSTGAHLPGLALPRQPAPSVQARYGFRCTESSCRLRRVANRSEVALAKKAGTPVASRPKRSVPAPPLVLLRFALQLPERPYRRRYPAQREADDEAGRAVDGEAESPAVDLPHSPEGLREEAVL